MSYCSYCRKLPKGNIHREYHDNRYGIWPVSDNEIFKRLTLEIMQAGLSWEIILKKENHISEAFYHWDIFLISQMGDREIALLLQNSNIIRHKLKIESVIHNANATKLIQEEHGSLSNWLKNQEIQSVEMGLIIMKKKFKFVGKEIVNEFFMSIGLINGAHDEDCSFL